MYRLCQMSIFINIVLLFNINENCVQNQSNLLHFNNLFIIDSLFYLFLFSIYLFILPFSPLVYRAGFFAAFNIIMKQFFHLATEEKRTELPFECIPL